jgi:hypothetical protein
VNASPREGGSLSTASKRQQACTSASASTGYKIRQDTKARRKKYRHARISWIRSSNGY